MDWVKVFIETFQVSFNTILRMVYIVIPLLILIECLKDSGWMEKISKYARSITKILGLPGEAAIGIVVGLFVGLLYGSGVIMQMQEEIKLNRYQLNVLFTFIGICHAIIEETILFIAIGAYGGVLVTSRILVGLIFTFIYIGIVQGTARLRAVIN